MCVCASAREQQQQQLTSAGAFAASGANAAAPAVAYYAGADGSAETLSHTESDIHLAALMHSQKRRALGSGFGDCVISQIYSISLSNRHWDNSSVGGLSVPYTRTIPIKIFNQ